MVEFTRPAQVWTVSEAYAPPERRYAGELRARFEADLAFRVGGKIAAAAYARENAIPCLGLCLGMQVMTIEYARHVLGLADANSTEFEPSTTNPVIDLMNDQRDVTDKGGTMRRVQRDIARQATRGVHRGEGPSLLGRHTGTP